MSSGKPLTEEDLEKIRELCNSGVPDEEIADKLDISPRTVSKKRRKAGLYSSLPWSEEEKEFLKNNYQKLTYRQIADHLDRPINGVSHQAERLNLKKEERWTDEEIEFLEEHYGKISAKEIGDKIGRSHKAVRDKAIRVGLSDMEKKGERISRFKKGNCNPEKMSRIAKEAWKQGKLNTEHLKPQSGRDHPRWKGGVSFEPYNLGFKRKAEMIRALFQNRCVLCWEKEKKHNPKLEVHHIDGDKNNNNISNLVPLHKKCHPRGKKERILKPLLMKVALSLV